MELEHYKSIGEALSLLLFPQAEIVLHDLKTGCIAAIFNNFSKRKVGDESLLDDVGNLSQDIFPPYIKTNWDGRTIKSVTAVLKDSNGTPMGLFCVNLDISKWEEMHRFIEEMIQPAIEKPEYLFKNDGRERMNDFISLYLKEKALRLESLTREEKKALILALHERQAFTTKNAAAYIADILGISRASVYNYIKGKNGTSDS